MLLNRNIVRRALVTCSLLTCSLLTCAGALLFDTISTAQAGSRDRRVRTADSFAIKDCTRFNGHWGYYGNPWCSPAQQRAFDRIETRRSGRIRR
ncbi:MAG: hypothetical protein AB7E80_04805 [Hyphomicrobiaceae bacterium]